MKSGCQKPEIGRVVVLEHPEYKVLADLAIDELHSAGLGVDIIRQQTPRTIDDAMELISTGLQPGDAVLIEGGDGSRSTILSGVLRLASTGTTNEQAIAAGIAFTSGTVGNGRDGARGDHGRWGMSARPSWILRNSVQAKAWGMDIRATELLDSGEQRDIATTALLYAGVGMTALCARIVNYPRYREYPGRLRRDIGLLLLAALSPSYQFTYTDACGKIQTATDLTFGKGHAIGKIGWLPTETWQPEIALVHTGPRLQDQLNTVGRAITNTLPPTHVRKTAITPTEDVYFYVDGEPSVRLAMDKELTVSLTDATYNVLTTRHPDARPSTHAKEL